MIAFILASTALAAMPEDPSDLLAIGACDAAVTASQRLTNAGEVALLKGHCAIIQGQYESAVDLLGAITDPTLVDYANLEQATALFHLGRHPDVASAIDGVILPAPFDDHVKLTGARSLVHQRKSLEARPALRDLLKTDLAAEARYWLAVGGAQRGDNQAAIATFWKLWSDSSSGWADKATDRLAELGESPPDPSTPEGQERITARAKTLTKANRHGEAAAMLGQLQSTKTTSATPSLQGLTLAEAKYKAKAYREAIDLYAEAYGEPASASGTANGLFHYALSYARLGEYDQAETIYRRVIVSHPTTNRAVTASYKIGYMRYDSGDYAGATTALKEHLSDYPGTPKKSDALWFLGRSAQLNDDLPAAHAAWEALIKEGSSQTLTAGARYWIARTKTDKEERSAAFEDLLRQHPDSGYAWFAAEQLQKQFDGAPLITRPSWPESLTANADVATADALLRIGLNSVAAAYLNRVTASTREEKLALAHAFIDAGEYRKGMKLAAPWCTKPWQGGDPVAMQACYPRPEKDIVKAMVAESSLEPLLPFGIMTAESALKPWVTSIAGAKGLMQLMPKVGGRAHERLFGDDSGRYNPEDLYRGPYNAALGSDELVALSNSLGDALDGSDLPAVIASYNGGEEAVQRWIEEQGGHPDADAFAEAISYTETRRYVRRVLGTVMVYRYIYGDNAQ